MNESEKQQNIDKAKEANKQRLGGRNFSEVYVNLTNLRLM